MSESLGKAHLELDVDVASFDRNLDDAGRSTDRLGGKLEGLAAGSKLAEDALQKIKMDAAQAYFTEGVSASMERSLGNIRSGADHAREAVRDIQMRAEQALETEAVGRRIDETLDKTKRKANETDRALRGVGGRNPGAGVGPFGSGFGRVGLLGTAIGAGVLAGPALGPGVLGLTALLPTALAGLGGVAGTLALALDGVGKAIGGDKKAFDSLVPAQKQFVLTVRSLSGWLDKLKQTAGSSLFPGITAGLKAALSPGTLRAITQAVTELGKALGQAGAQWGRFFGSTEFQSIFGPLMRAAAQSVTTLSTAALSLFDALGVLGRAAIPFTNWLTESTAKGAAWLDTFLHAKDASGALARGLDAAKGSLTLAAKLVESLGRVVVALGKALYPVSNVFLKDVTDALNWLAGSITRNQKGIRDFVGGALAALKSTAKTLAPLIAAVARDLNRVVKAIGGWKTAFEIVLTGALALKLLKVADSIKAITSASNDAGKSSFLAKLLGLGGRALFTPAGVAAAAAAAVLASSGSAPNVSYPTGQFPLVDELRRNQSGDYSRVPGLLPQVSALNAKRITDAQMNAWLTAHFQAMVKGGFFNADDLERATTMTHSGTAKKLTPGQASSVGNIGSTLNKMIAGAIGKVTAALNLGPDGSPISTSNPPFTKNLGPKAPKHPSITLPYQLSGSFRPATPILGPLLPDSVSGSFTPPSGINLLSVKDRLAIDAAKITPGKLDDIAALTHARDGLERLAKTLHGIEKIPLADEIANLSSKINALSGSVDGFDLTLAEQHRHILDRTASDKYHADAAARANVTHHFNPVYQMPDETSARRKSKQDFFHYRQLMPAL